METGIYTVFIVNLASRTGYFNFRIQATTKWFQHGPCLYGTMGPLLRECLDLKVCDTTATHPRGSWCRWPSRLLETFSTWERMQDVEYSAGEFHQMWSPLPGSSGSKNCWVVCKRNQTHPFYTHYHALITDVQTHPRVASPLDFVYQSFRVSSQTSVAV